MKRLLSFLGRMIDAVRVVLGRLIFLLIIGVVLYAVFSGPEPMTVPDEAALVWSPSGVITEQRSQANPADLLLGPAMPENSVLQDLVDALQRAGEDDRITALVMDLEDLLGVSPAHIEILGDALADFKDSGKLIYAYGDYFSQGQYALASYADTITLHPMGSVMITGYGGNQLFVRDLLDKLNINVHVFRVGEFKSAAEPFTRMDMSDEARADAQTLMGELWSGFLARVAPNRERSPAELQAYADRFPELLMAASGDMSRVAFEQGLVDNIAGIDSFRRQVAASVGVDNDNGSFRQIHYKDYLGATDRIIPPLNDQVAVIVAQGTIMPGEQPQGLIGADDVSELVRIAQQSDAVKALVLRIDSPGGAALASEEIRAALTQFQQSGRPVVVSMGSTAASGGYWIAATADRILASSSTITGSIGVIGMIPTFEEALDNLGIGVDGVGTTAMSRAGDPLSGMDDVLATIYQSTIDDAYQRFIQLVSDGRDIPLAEVDALAQGRVWTGAQALELDLVDELGDLEQAIASAAELAGLQAWQEVYVEQPLSFGEQMLIQMMDSMGATQVLATVRDGVVSGLRNSPAHGALDLSRVLAGVPAHEVQRWQSMMDLILPQDYPAQRLRTLLVCNVCVMTPH
ncbi:MAG: signal peptide peptidase SppA [Pseudohongiella sp.]|uniref:signal peptide peptidase SppA n=1 Tax=Pseudohongiella sp. TaxID=1979412 RepID=UPI0034A09E2A